MHGGECRSFTDGGNGHMVLCVDHGALNQADRVMQSNANLTNTGSVPLCNVTIKVTTHRLYTTGA